MQINTTLFDDIRHKLEDTLDEKGWLYELDGCYVRYKPDIDSDAEKGTFDSITIYHDFISFTFDIHENVKNGVKMWGDCPFECLKVEDGVLKMIMPLAEMEIRL